MVKITGGQENYQRKRNIKKAREELRIWNNEETRANDKNRKTEYRRCQRWNIFVFEEKKNRNIERLFSKTNKDDFWKSVQSYKEDESHKELTKDEREELINEIKSLFTMDNELLRNDEQKLNIVETVKNYEKSCRHNIRAIEKVYVNDVTIRKIIKELKNLNTRGHDGMNNNMIKMILVNDIVVEKITSFINLILFSGYVPKSLNTSIIIPIMKNKTLNKFEKHNYIPISVSNVFAQILEKVILVNCPIINASDSAQFGFKNLMSFIFIERSNPQTQTRRKTTVYSEYGLGESI